MLRTSAEGTEKLRVALDEVMAEPGAETLDMCAVFNRLVEQDRKAVRVFYVQGDWIHIDSLADVAKGYGS
jgi:hypothetical protein